MRDFSRQHGIFVLPFAFHVGDPERNYTRIRVVSVAFGSVPQGGQLHFPRGKLFFRVPLCPGATHQKCAM